MNTASPPLLQIHDLCVDFPTRHGTVQAVRDFNLQLAPGEIHGIVGESGAGKSTVGAAVLGLLHAPGYLRAGRISLEGKTISGLDAEAMQQLRGKRISTVFQDPLTALNPLFTVREQLVETIQTHLPLATVDANARALDLMERVGIPDPHTRLNQYPHQFSGGMRQRVVIALALCSEPDVIIADEPTTALDVAVQAQILDLIRDLVAERQVGVVLVTHDMGVIADTTDTVSVMRNGELVEQGPTAQVLGQPSHPYTQALIAAVPRPDVTTARFAQLQAGKCADCTPSTRVR